MKIKTIKQNRNQLKIRLVRQEMLIKPVKTFNRFPPLVNKHTLNSSTNQYYNNESQYKLNLLIYIILKKIYFYYYYFDKDDKKNDTGLYSE